MHAACNHVATETATLTENMLQLVVANLTYLGAGHSSTLQDMARAVADLMAAAPQKAATMVILPNTAVKGMGTNNSEEFMRQARRQTMEKFEAEMWHLESRECSFHFDEAQMYSPCRPLSHSMLFLMSNLADKNEAIWRRSTVWNRRCLPGPMPVQQRADFVNPVDEQDGQSTMKRALSEPAEYRQHVTGAAFYKQVPQTQRAQCLQTHMCSRSIRA